MQASENHRTDRTGTKVSRDTSRTRKTDQTIVTIEVTTETETLIEVEVRHTVSQEVETM